MLQQDPAGDEAFRQMLWHVLPVALGAFGFAGLLLMFFVRGFRQNDEKRGKASLPARMVVLCVTLLVIGVIFVVIDQLT